MTRPLLFLALLLPFAAGCRAQEGGPLAPRDFLQRLDADDVVIDVRTPAEFADGHLADAQHVDVTAPDFAARVDAFDREGTYYLYCHSGRRSARAAAIMREMGFRDVHNVGGFADLARAGAPVAR